MIHNPPPLNQPRNKTHLFVAFSLLALQGFGGVLAVVQRELVERRRWMTLEQFVEDWAVAQILPGPNVINLALMIGGRYFGLGGAMAALAGLLLAPLVIVLGLAMWFATVAQSPYAAGALRGMGAVTAGLIIATGLKLLPALRTNAMGPVTSMVLAVVTFLAIAWWRLPLAWVLLGLGGLGCVWAWRSLARLDGAV